MNSGGCISSTHTGYVLRYTDIGGPGNYVRVDEETAEHASFRAVSFNSATVFPTLGGLLATLQKRTLTMKNPIPLTIEAVHEQVTQATVTKAVEL